VDGATNPGLTLLSIAIVTAQIKISILTTSVHSLVLTAKTSYNGLRIRTT
jgi:hypothetical protein